MQFQPGDRVTITNPHPENVNFQGKTGTVSEINDDNGLVVLRRVEGPIRGVILGGIACAPDELTKD